VRFQRANASAGIREILKRVLVSRKANRLTNYFCDEEASEMFSKLFRRAFRRSTGVYLSA